MVLALTLPEPPDLLARLAVATFVAVFPVHLGTVLTGRRLGPRQRGRPRDHDRSVVGWIGSSVVSAGVFLAVLHWHDVWTGPDREWLVAAAPGLFHAVGISSAVRFRRSAAGAGDRDREVLASPAPQAAPERRGSLLA